MKFKFRKILSDKQVFRAKWSASFATLLVIGLITRDYFVTAEDEDIIKWNEKEWASEDIATYPRGVIKYYGSNSEICNSPILVPGIPLLPRGLLAIVYGLALVYLFLGISIVADLFVAGIEQITAKKQIIEIKAEDGEVVETKKVLFWNGTIANLSLMALGSSAPEILLSVIEAFKNLGKCPGELGPSTIVGSAAFNLLVISAVAIYSVNETNDTDTDKPDEMKGIKKINDMGVFAVTAIFSILSYIWLFVVLRDQQVEVWEAWTTFVLFFVLLILAYAADKWKASQGGADDKNPLMKNGEIASIEYSAHDIYKSLIKEKQSGAKDMDPNKLIKMKKYVKEQLGTDQVESIDFEELKKKVDGEGLISRIKYRHQVGNFMTGKKPVIAKGEVVKLEHAHASSLEEKDRNPHFGFRCLHYSVSEGSGSIRVYIDNKQKAARTIHVKTIDAEATAGEDYEAVDKGLTFKQGEKFKYIDIKIIDDEGWEPDEDFFVQLYDEAGVTLPGMDARTKITILDDDKPGQISFKEDKAIKAIATEKFADIYIVRKNGSDGVVTVEYSTEQIDDTPHTATPKIDYIESNGTLTFEHGETEKVIQVEIVQKPEEQRDESFGIKLFNITPAGAKLSKKSFHIVNIITDIDGKKKHEALKQLLEQMEDEEEKTWKSQFISACMLHPTKNEFGEIEDISGMEVFLHFTCIGWKLVFAFIPPAHYFGGWGCFLVALAMIGGVTYIVGEVANLFGCVLNIPPAITAITFVALGTSLPDTFASKVAAVQEQYADSAVGNVTGSNSVNVLLGLGLPWVIATSWEQLTPTETKKYTTDRYFVPAGTLGFSVIVFVAVAIVAIILLLVRRKMVGGELGGSSNGRLISAVAFCSLWVIYIVLSIFQSLNIGGIGDYGWGIDLSVQNPNGKCNALSE